MRSCQYSTFWRKSFWIVIVLVIGLLLISGSIQNEQLPADGKLQSDSKAIGAGKANLSKNQEGQSEVQSNTDSPPKNKCFFEKEIRQLINEDLDTVSDSKPGQKKDICGEKIDSCCEIQHIKMLNNIKEAPKDALKKLKIKVKGEKSEVEWCKNQNIPDDIPEKPKLSNFLFIFIFNKRMSYLASGFFIQLVNFKF